MANVGAQHSIMCGNFQQVPPMNTKMIKIFLSSTFSDMTLERNYLMKYVYPRLKEYCRSKYSTEFQVVDMRWGVRPESQLDHQGPQLCFDELVSCQATSTGPNFVTILGQRYGGHPPPYSIPCDEFRHIVQLLKEDEEVNREALDTLQEWYIEDTNCVPPEVVLRPIVEIEDENDEALVKLGKKKWYAAETILLECFNSAVKVLLDRGHISPEQAHKYSASVTEKEIAMGIFQLKSSDRRLCSAFLRHIDDVENHCQDQNITKFLDVGSDQHLAQKMLKLREDVLAVLHQENVFQYSEEWDAIVGDNETAKADYLQRFGVQFRECLQRLVDQGMEERSRLFEEELFVEVLQHANTCSNYVKHFHGRQTVLQRAKEYLLGTSHVPLIVHGFSGSGKTAILAKSAVEAQSWLAASDEARGASEEALILLRFLGTSPGTSNLRQTLRFLCQQLAYFTNEADREHAKQVDNVQDIQNLFMTLLEKVATQREIVLFLDSLDQLDSADACHHLGWLPNRLPDRVKMVISTLPDMFGLLETLRSRFPEADNFLEVLPMSNELCTEIVEAHLQERRRTVTPWQWEILQEAFRNCSLPIFVTLVMNQVMSWRSFFSPEDARLRIETSVQGAILQLFRNWEKKHGALLTSHALAYITASKNGVSENELEDLLSLDDEVLRDVFQFHLPPQIRIPPFCWSRLRRDIGNYLVEREADHVRVVAWYHRQFIEAARSHFLHDSEFRKKIHSNMADYFNGRWSGGKRKPFEYPEYLRSKLKLPISNEEDRMVAEQPMLYEESQLYETTLNRGERQIRYNLRHLNEYPWHLVHSGRLEECLTEVVFNFPFLLHKMRATSRHELLEDVERVVHATSREPQVTLLFNAIRISSQSLTWDPYNLSVDLLGRLSGYSANCPRIEHLLQQCRSLGLERSVLVPRGQVFESGSGEIYNSFDIGLSVSLVISNDLICALPIMEKTMKLFDTNGNLIRTAEIPFSCLESMTQLSNRKIPANNICSLIAYKPSVIRPDGNSTEDGLPVVTVPPEAISMHNRGQGLSFLCYRINFSTCVCEPVFALHESLLGQTDKIEHIGETWLLTNQKDFYYLIHVEEKRLYLWKKVENDRNKVGFSFALDESTIVISEIVGDDWSLSVLKSANMSEPLYTFSYRRHRPSIPGNNVVGHLPLNTGDVMVVVEESLPKDAEAAIEFRIDILRPSHDETIAELEVVQSVHLDESVYVGAKLWPSPRGKYVFADARHKEKSANKCGFLWECGSSSITWLSMVGGIDERMGLILALRAYSPEEDLLVLCGQGIHIFSTATGQQLRILQSSCMCVMPAVTHKDKLLVVSGFPRTRPGQSNSDTMSIRCFLFNVGDIHHTETRFADSNVMNRISWTKTTQPYRLLADPLDEMFYFVDTERPGRRSLFDGEEMEEFHSFEFNEPDSKEIFVYCRIFTTENGKEIFCVQEKLEKHTYYSDYDKSDGSSFVKLTFDDIGLDRMRCDSLQNRRNYTSNSMEQYGALLMEKQVFLTINLEYFSDDFDDGKTSEVKVTVHPFRELKAAHSNILPIPHLESSENFDFSDSDTSNELSTNGKWIYNKQIHKEISISKFMLSQVQWRPNHKHQLVLVAYTSSKLEVVSRRLCQVTGMEICHLFNPGVIILVDCSQISPSNDLYKVELLSVSYTDIFSNLWILPDGLHAVNYRLQVLHLESGRVVRHIRPLEDEIYFMRMLPLHGGRFLAGMFMEPATKADASALRNFMSNESEMTMFIPHSDKVVRVYRLTDGALVANYVFSMEPMLIEVNRAANRIYYFGKENIVSMDVEVEGLQSALEREITWTFQEELCEDVSEAGHLPGRQSSFLRITGIEYLLQAGLFELVNLRPKDPILYLATYLKSHSQTITDGL